MTKDPRQKQIIVAWLENSRASFTDEQLKDAFTAVQNKEHWKNDVDAIVDASLKDVVPVAIEWYTGTSRFAVMITDLPDEKIRVQASGYWSNGMG